MSDSRTNYLKSLPDSGIVFWPVGTGDCTTISIGEDKIIQIDIRQTEDAKENQSKYITVLDELEKLLPKVDGKPYLALFVLTHPDKDHCQGFQELLDKVNIGEMWFTPRIFSEYKKDLCDDAKAFRDEAKRRVKKTISEKANVSSGDRVRIIGYTDLLEKEEFNGFPDSKLTVPGNNIMSVDGENVSERFRAFVHAPFKDDSEEERNDTSVSLQITLSKNDHNGRLLVFGDLCYPTLSRIFSISKKQNLEWNVLLTPHHCSKSVMYWKSESDDNKEHLKQDILDEMEKSAKLPGYVVASCDPVPSSNNPGDNPPHAKAKNRYEEIVPNKFLCTQEYPNEKNPKPVIFILDENGFYLQEEENDNASSSESGDGVKSLTTAVAGVRGSEKPPSERVGFGIWS